MFVQMRGTNNRDIYDVLVFCDNMIQYLQSVTWSTPNVEIFSVVKLFWYSRLVFIDYCYRRDWHKTIEFLIYSFFYLLAEDIFLTYSKGINNLTT